MQLLFHLLLLLACLWITILQADKIKQQQPDELTSEPCLLWSFQTQISKRTAVTGSIVNYPSQPNSFMASGISGRIGYFSSNGILKGTYVSQPSGIPSDPVFNTIDSSIYFRVTLGSFQRITSFNHLVWAASLSTFSVPTEVQNFYLSVPSNPTVISSGPFLPGHSSIVAVGGVNTLYVYYGSQTQSSLAWSFSVGRCVPPPLYEADLTTSDASDESAWLTTPDFSSDDNLIFFTTTCGEIYALSAVDGSLVWAVDVGQDQTADLSYEILSPVKYAVDSVYFGASLTFFNATTGVSTQDNFIFSLDAKTGSVNWKVQAFGPVNNRPLVVSSSILFGEGFTVTSRSLKDGSIIWSNLLEYQILASPYSPSPDSANPPLYIATLGAIFAFDSNGKELWTIPGSMVGTPLVSEASFVIGDVATTESVLIITDQHSVFGFADWCNGGCDYNANYSAPTTQISTCSGEGDCRYGTCACVYGYTGTDCQSCDDGFSRTDTGCRVDSSDSSSDTKAYVGLIVVVCIVVFFGIIVVVWWFYRARHERDGWRREENL